MKRLTEGAHQTSDDLTVAKTESSECLLDFGELLFTGIYNAKHTRYYLLCVSNKVGESSRWKHMVL